MQRWKRFEYRIKYFLEEMGFKAQRVPLSGISKLMKGDIIAKKGDIEILVDAKSTKDKNKIVIDLFSLEKLRNVCEEKIPIVVFSFWKHKFLYGIADLNYFKDYFIECYFKNYKIVEKNCKRYVTFNKELLRESVEKNICIALNSKNGRYIVMELRNLIKMLEGAKHGRRC